MATEKVTLGFNVAAGEKPVVAVPGGCWKALRLHDGASYALMANALSPEFTPDRVKIGAGADWIKRFANAAPWATPKSVARNDWTKLDTGIALRPAPIEAALPSD